MRFKKFVPVASVVLFLTACGETASNKTSDGRDTTTTEVTTTTVTTSNTSNVPEVVQTDFRTKYPAATNITWQRYEPIDRIEWDWTGWPVLDTSDYMVMYVDNGVDYYAWYDQDNNWIGTTSTLKDNASLPDAVNKTVQKELPGYNIVSIDKENDKNTTAYEVKLEKGNDKAKLLVSEDGKVMKKVTKVDGQKTKEKTK